MYIFFLARPVVKQLIAEIVPHGVLSGFLQKSTKIAMLFSVLQCSSIHFHEPGRISLGGRDGELGQLYTITQHAVITKSEYFTSVYEVMLIVIRHETIISFVWRTNLVCHAGFNVGLNLHVSSFLPEAKRPDFALTRS